MKGRSTRISRKLAVSAASLVALVIVSAVMANGIPRFSPGDSRQAAAQQLTPTPTPTLTPTATATANGDCDLWVNKSESSSLVSEGGQITYTITVSNDGSGSGYCTDLVVTDTIPDDTDCTDATVDSSSDISEANFDIYGCDTSGDVMWDTTANLYAGDQVVLKMVVVLTSGATEGDTISNEACATSTSDVAGDCDDTQAIVGLAGSISGTVTDASLTPLTTATVTAEQLTPHDSFADPFVFPSIPHSLLTSTSTARNEPQEPQPCVDIGRTVWAIFTAPNTGIVVVDTEGSDYDTALAVYTGDSLPGLIPIDCDDDGGTGLHSRISFTATAGATYRVQAGGYSGETGSLRLNVSLTGQLPPNVTDVPCCTTRSASAGVDGSYTIADLPADSYIVRSHSEGYIDEYYDGVRDSDHASPVPVTEGQSTPHIDFSLDPGGTISGTVTDTGGNPLARCRVYADPWDGDGPGGEDSTDAGGSYIITGLISGDYRVYAECGPYITEYFDGARHQDDATSVHVTEGEDSPGIDFALDLGGTITGTVTDTGGIPLEDCWVYADSWDGSGGGGYGYADATGHYTITGLATGDYRVEVYSDGYVPQYYDAAYDPNHATPVHVVEGEDTPGINFNLHLEGTISGNVEDSEANPVSGAKVCADSNDLESCDWTDGDGYYLINGLIGGEYVVNAKAFGYVREYYLDARTAGAATPVLVTEREDTPNVNFALDIGGTVTATITDGSTANPIEDAWVAADPSQTVFTSAASPPDVPEDGGSCQTNASGQCTITGLATGDYLIRAGGVNYLTSYFDGAISKADADPVAVVEGDDTTVALTLDPVGCGDTNEDRRTSMVDAMLIAQYVAGLIGSGSLNLTVADVNSSGGVSMVDAMLVAQYVAGLIGHLPCGLPASTPTPVASPTAGP
jgi:uncharacterized repeat protein (TIGR01451 family)